MIEQVESQFEGGITVIMICTDRLKEAKECLQSLGILGRMLKEILLLKNAPTEPWPKDVFEDLSEEINRKLKVIVSDRRVFPTTGRNILERCASGSAYLFLDDDSKVLSAEGVQLGMRILGSDDTVGSIAFPQASSIGDISSSMQPAPVSYPCYTCGFISCAALVKADVYKALNGFQEILGMAHEENEFCKRQWDAGLAVVYLPIPCICHEPTKTARNSVQRFVLNARNGWYQAILHEPLWVLAMTIVPRILKGRSYLKENCSSLNVDWRPKFREALLDLRRDFGALWKARRALKFGTILKWLRIKRKYPKYEFRGGTGWTI